MVVLKKPKVVGERLLLESDGRMASVISEPEIPRAVFKASVPVASPPDDMPMYIIAAVDPA